jgi:hypothetical protein
MSENISPSALNNFRRVLVNPRKFYGVLYTRLVPLDPFTRMGLINNFELIARRLP